MYGSVLGLLDHSAQIATRDGNFIANPLGAPLVDHVRTHTFDIYVQDTWKVRRSLTVTYGLSYGVSFAPTEKDGKQVLEIFSASGQPLQNLMAYFQQRNAALSNGQFFASGLTAGTDNTFGFAPIRHIAGRSSSADTHWNNLGPRVAVAWQVPYKNKVFGNNQTVIRGGYSILWNRTNGVTEALIPLHGTFEWLRSGRSDSVFPQRQFGHPAGVPSQLAAGRRLYRAIRQACMAERRRSGRRSIREDSCVLRGCGRV
jgi:hypothetical protein